MAELGLQEITLSGLSLALQAASAGGDTFKNDGNTFLVVDNADAADITVTITAQRTCNLGFLHDQEVTVPAGSRLFLGPFNTKRFNDDSDQVHVSYSAVTNVTVGAVQL